MQQAGSSQPSENGGGYLGQALYISRALPASKTDKIGLISGNKKGHAYGWQTVSESRCCEHLKELIPEKADEVNIDTVGICPILNSCIWLPP